jgi:hypothetical protein
MATPSSCNINLIAADIGNVNLAWLHVFVNAPNVLVILQTFSLTSQLTGNMVDQSVIGQAM